MLGRCRPSTNDNYNIPLPPNKKTSTTACPAIESEESCYLIPLKHQEVLKWYGEESNTRGWIVSDASDVAPFHLLLASIDDQKRVLIVIYEQLVDIETGVLVSEYK